MKPRKTIIRKAEKDYKCPYCEQTIIKGNKYISVLSSAGRLQYHDLCYQAAKHAKDPKLFSESSKWISYD